MWQPADYILYGQYSDQQSVRALLEAIRQRTGARAAILIAFEPDSFEQLTKNPLVLSIVSLMRSLYLVAAEPDTRSRLEALNVDSFSKRDKGLTPPMLSVPDHGFVCSVEQLFGRVSNLEPFHGIVQHFGPTTKVQVLRWMSAVPHVGKPTCAAPIVFLAAPQQAGVDSWLQAQIDALSVLLTASPCVSTRRGRRVFLSRERPMSLEATDPMVSIEADFAGDANWVERSLEKIADQIVQYAVGHTDSGDGALYLIQPDAQILRMAGTYYSDDGWRSELPHPKTVPLDHSYLSKFKNILTDVWDPEVFRPRLINEANEFRRLYDTLPPLPGGQFAPHIVVPIMQGSIASNHFSNFGVLIVRKGKQGRANPYTHYDFVAAQQLAHKFCHWRSCVTFVMAGRSLSYLTEQNLESVSAFLADPPRDAAAEVQIHTPIEAWQVRDKINSALMEAMKLTRSFVGSVRILSADTKRAIRFCHGDFVTSASAESRPDNEVAERLPRTGAASKDVIPWSIDVTAEDRLSCIHNVITNGDIWYVPDIYSPKYQDMAARSGIHLLKRVSCKVKSLINVPFFVGSRIAGTLFLASAYRDEYAEVRGLLRAVAGQIGLALAVARHGHECQLIRLTADALGFWHHVKNLRTSMSSHRTSIADAVSVVESYLDRQADLGPMMPLSAQTREQANVKHESHHPPHYPTVPSRDSILDNGHDFAACLDAIREIQNHATDLAQECNYEVDPILVPKEEQTGWVPVVELLQHVSAEWQASQSDRIALEWVGSAMPAKYVVPLSASPAFRAAWWELLKNANSHDELPMRCSFSEVRLGGRTFLRVTYRNNRSDSVYKISNTILRRLFRTPCEKPGRNRSGLGCFIAGALFRSLGGDVFIDELKRKEGLVRFAVDVLQPSRGIHD
jgi:GAF domain-containing protein